MNSFSRLLFAALTILLISPAADAINLHALYTASCTRQIGIILNVTPRKIFLLNLEGEIVPIERFEVISYATYPLDVVPMTKVGNPQVVPLVRIMTFQKGELVELIRGWPVDFSSDKIAFLSLKGSERLIERRSIWKVEFQSELKDVQFESQVQSAYDFVHPYAFSSCQNEAKGKAIKVFPQQLLSDPVAIKREMDRLIIGHTEVKNYESDQQFYPVPEVYGNETTLGMWLAEPSRYGASKNRQNNFTPFLVTEYSGGPFGFQREFRTGAGPILMGLHEEPQTQIFYRMKADYFHLSAFADPGLLLVGSKYKWFAADMNDTDIRVNDVTLLEFGFDYGAVALELHFGGSANLGARSGNFFNRSALGTSKFGLRYQGKIWTLNVFGGAGSGTDAHLNIFRVNFEVMARKFRKFAFSFIQRKAKYDGPDQVTDTPFSVEGNSQTFAGYGYWRVKSRYWTGAMLALENIDVTDGGRTGGYKAAIPKFGALVSLSF